MEAPRWSPPPTERELGLGFYVTGTPPVAGRLKAGPEDFRVREISLYPLPDAAGPFTVLRVRSRDWEQHELAQRLARELGLPRNAVAWAGTKDRRAVAERLLSYRGAPPERPVGLPGVELLEAYRARDGLVLGHHFGNAFDLRVTGLAVEPAVALEGFRATLEELRQRGAFANFFGAQRFGEVRPITHRVGRALVLGDVALAVETYLTEIPAGEAEPVGAEARRAYAEHHDAARALREFPAHFRFERQLLDHLARGHDPARALRALSRELRSLFVHAYQALLFNRWVSRRVERRLSLAVPEPGDTLLRVARDGTVPGVGPVPVTDDNLAECRRLAERGRARLAGPLVGFETPRATGPGAELLDELLAEEGVTREAFRLTAAPEVASAGSFRPILVPMPPIALGEATDPSEGPGAVVPPAVRFAFSLPKGVYATILLREFLKPGARPSPDQSKPLF